MIIEDIVAKRILENDIINKLVESNFIPEKILPDGEFSVVHIYYELIMHSTKTLSFKQFISLIEYLSSFAEPPIHYMLWSKIINKMILQEDEVGEAFPIKNSQDLFNYMNIINSFPKLGNISILEILLYSSYSFISNDITYLDFQKILQIIFNIGGWKLCSEKIIEMVTNSPLNRDPKSLLNTLKSNFKKEEWKDLNYFYLIIGSLSGFMHQYEKSLELLDRINLEYEPMIHYTRGELNRKLKKYELAISNYLCALKIFESKSFPKEVSKLYILIAQIYYRNIKDYDKALEYYKKLMENDIKYGNITEVPKSYFFISRLAFKNRNYDLYVENNLMSVKYNRKLANYEDAKKSLEHIISFLERQQISEQIIDYRRELDDLYSELNDKKGKATNFERIADTVLKLGKTEEAITYYEKSIGFYEELRNWAHLIKVNHKLARLHETIGNIKNSNLYYKSAYEYYNKAEIAQILDYLEYGRFKEIEEKINLLYIDEENAFFLEILRLINRALNRLVRFDYYNARSILLKLKEEIKKHLGTSSSQIKIFLKAFQDKILLRSLEILEEIITKIKNGNKTNIFNLTFDIYEYRINLADINGENTLVLHLTIAYIERLIERKLFQEYNIISKKMDWSIISEENYKGFNRFIKNYTRAYDNREIKTTRRLSLNLMYLILAFLDNDFFQFYKDHKKSLNRIRIVRNNTYLGHEARMTPKSIVNKCLDIIPKIKKSMGFKSDSLNLITLQQKSIQKLINFIIFNL
ncbi:MAG: tetratricopeptide repeat protein [Candidatus Lokiarchaeota archaeon]|nr:tetratricopeptide repeat protein [Candidatus Lokiarchaeota archaeon]